MSKVYPQILTTKNFIDINSFILPTESTTLLLTKNNNFDIVIELESDHGNFRPRDDVLNKK